MPHDQINNAGGYLRSLTERAKDGKFSTWPMVMALLRAKLDAGKQSLELEGLNRDSSRSASAQDGKLPISSELRNLLTKRPK